MAPDPTAERRSIVLAGLAFAGVIGVLVAVAIVFAGGAGDERTPAVDTAPCAPDDTACLTARAGGERPGIIPQPGQGRAPTEAGDPGGWAQIALFAGIVVALGAIVGFVVRASRRARATTAAGRPPGAGATAGDGSHDRAGDGTTGVGRP